MFILKLFDLCEAFLIARIISHRSELVLLQELEEVLDFEAAIFGHVCAVHCVANSIQPKLRSIQT